MAYRILLLCSGLLMMFAVFSLVLTIGSVVGGSDTWKGNLILGLCFVTLTTVFLVIGLVKRKAVYSRIETEIAAQLVQHNYVDAKVFAQSAGISLDDARDQLDKRMKTRGWQRTELPEDNAQYHKK